MKFEDNLSFDAYEVLSDSPVLLRKGVPKVQRVVAPREERLFIEEPECSLPPKNEALKNMPEPPKDFKILSGVVTVDVKHVQEKILEPFEVESVEDVDLTRLLDLISREVWTKESCSVAAGYEVEVEPYTLRMKDNLQSLINYANSKDCGVNIREKLRFVIKQLLSAEYDIKPMMEMLSSHSAVCNVQKEIGVRLAYSACCEVDEFACDSLENQIRKILYSLRESCVEELYKIHISSYVNSHSIVPYRNTIHDKVGLDRIPDEYARDYKKENLWNVETFYSHFYHIDRIIKTVHFAINEKKVKYESVLNFLKEKRPKRFGSGEDFLYEVFEEDSGKFTVESTVFILAKMGVLKGADVDGMYALEEDQIRRSVDPVAVLGKGKEEEED